MSSDNYGAGAPPGSGSGGSGARKKKKPIGVPEGYSVELRKPSPGYNLPFVGHQTSVGYPQGARYFKGDEWQLAPTNSQDIMTVQQALVQTGLLDAKGLVYGQWDPKSAAGFSKLLAISNQGGVEWKDALAARMAATGSDSAAPKSEVPPLTIKLTNPDDLRAVAKNVSKTLYGGDLPEEDLQRFVSSYQESERQAQTQAYNQQYDPSMVNASGSTGGYGPGGETVATPDPTSAVEAQIRRDHPEQVAATGIGSSVMKSLDNLRTTGYL